MRPEKQKVDAGLYLYRGHEVADSGNGRSVTDRNNRSRGRWTISRVRVRDASGDYTTERVNGARHFGTMREALARVDALCDQSSADTCAAS